MLRFSDGMAFNTCTDDNLRIMQKSDGLYVVGGGMVIPVNSVEEGNKIINNDCDD